jgi:predicted nucleotidyltransferase
MATNRADRYVQPYRYASPNIPLSAIRRLARQIGERFHPDKVILFGSYAYGTPHNESDVDLLVIVPTRDVIAKANRISGAFERLFSHSIIVRTPRQVESRLREDDRDWFLFEIVTKGKVLYEASHAGVAAQSGGRHRICKDTGGARKTQTRRSMLPLSASSRKIPQGTASRKRHGPAKNS